ncbi:MAG: CPBP family glutamic-type intramembrane protease, partial [Dehalococcoidia bacterium]
MNDQAEHYFICVPTESHRQWLQGVLEGENAERASALAEYQRAAAAAGKAVADDHALSSYLRNEQVTIDVVGPDASIWELVAEQTYHAGIVVSPPPDPEKRIQVNNHIVQVIYCDTDPRSQFVFGELHRILAHESDRVFTERITQLAGGRELLRPLTLNTLTTASSAMQFARILAMVVPFLLVTMTVTGAMYPAIDLTAGERERGTLETLAVSPVPVGQIVAGKFIVIVTIAMISTMLNLASMTAMLHFSKLDRLAASLQGGRQAEALAVEEMIERAAQVVGTGPSTASQQSVRPGPWGADRLDGRTTSFAQREYLMQSRRLEGQASQGAGFLTTAVPIVLLAMIPFAVLFGGIMLAACSFARTFKEAQNYMMPVMMAAIVPAMVVSYMPTVKLEGVLLVMPVANVVILMRELFLGNYDIPAMSICLLSTCFYVVIAVVLVAKLYGNEAVLFSDVGSYRTLLRRRFIRPRIFPSAAFALLTVAVLFPANFYWQTYLLDVDSSTARFRIVIALALVLIVAAPAILLSWYLKLDMRRTFSLHVPGVRPSIGAVLLGFSIVPMSSLLQQIQFTYFSPASGPGQFPGLQEQWMVGGSLVSMLLVLAVLPGICEELLFRGFLLAGLRQRLSTVLLVMIVGLTFGLHHMGSEKIPIVSLMGMLLTFICLRAGSIFPAMVVHIANNGLALAATRFDAWWQFFGLPDAKADLPAIQFDARTGMFLLVFIVGFIFVAVGGKRSHSGSG